MKVVALAGGTGSAKLLRGLAATRSDLTVVCNVGDNFVWHGLLVCPDVDIAMYALAGTGDPGRGWGMRGDTFNVLRQLQTLGAETWFRMGDRDLATSVVRSDLIHGGATLTEATEQLRRMHHVSQRVLPATDGRLETRVVTAAGNLHLQEFWVRDRGKGRVIGVEYGGAAKATISRSVSDEISSADRVVICPANPVTSVAPILSAGGMIEALGETPARISALSPMIGRKPFSGPAGKLMRAVGLRADSVGVAKLYSRFLDVLVVDRKDANLKGEIEGLGVGCRISDTRIAGRRDAIRLAEELISA